MGGRTFFARWYGVNGKELRGLGGQRGRPYKRGDLGPDPGEQTVLGGPDGNKGRKCVRTGQRRRRPNILLAGSSWKGWGVIADAESYGNSRRWEKKGPGLNEKTFLTKKIAATKKEDQHVSRR